MREPYQEKGNPPESGKGKPAITICSYKERLPVDTDCTVITGFFYILNL